MWEELRKKAIERIYHDREIGYLDPDIWDFLMAFYNYSEKIFTQSSCSGRVTIVDAEVPWDRKNSSVVYKNHMGISLEDLKDIISKGQVSRLWLIVQGPIVHVYAKDMDTAWNVLQIARNAGFKHSGILVSNYKGILLELRTGVRMTHLLKNKVDDSAENLSDLVEVANEVLRKGKEKMIRLTEALSSNSKNPMELRKNPKLETL